MLQTPPSSPPFPYTTISRSRVARAHPLHVVFFSKPHGHRAKSAPSVRVRIILAESEPAAKIEEVGGRQFPAGKLAGGQFLLSREGRIDEVLFPLQLQDLHGLGHGLKKIGRASCRERV